jgi:hypothetical protein
MRQAIADALPEVSQGIDICIYICYNGGAKVGNHLTLHNIVM